MLAPRATSARSLPLKIPIPDVYLRLGGNWHHRDRNGAGVGSATFFRRRNPLPSVSTRLIGKGLYCAFPRYFQDHLPRSFIDDGSAKAPS